MFPGVVPRTFLGAAGLAALAKPAVALLGAAEEGDRVRALVLVRLVLAAAVWHGVRGVRRALDRSFGPATGTCFTAVSVLQFHLPFYAGRPLPNTFALVLVLHAWRWVIRGVQRWEGGAAAAAELSGGIAPVPPPWHLPKSLLRSVQSSVQSSATESEPAIPRVPSLIAVQCLVVAAVLFRCDVVVLLVPVLLMDLALHVKRPGCASGRRLWTWTWNMLVAGAVAGFGSLAITVLVDSYFWRRWLWPEFDVFFYNAVENKSSDWGTEPWYWYFTSALPRSCLAAYPVALAAPLVLAFQGRSGRGADGATAAAAAPPRFETAVCVLFPALAFVALYSLLPHKELRFIFYAVPAFNVVAAIWMGALWETWKRPGRERSISWSRTTARNVFCVLALAVLAGLGAIFLFSGASYSNYPGGEALRKLHRLDVQVGRVHIGVRAAMTGVSRFGYQYGGGGQGWSYSKDETFTSPSQYESFSHLLTDNPSFHEERFEVVEEVTAFAGGGMSVLRRLAKLQWPFAAEPVLWIMRKKLLK
jgi:alpha-1,6-mannosyltransferase